MRVARSRTIANSVFLWIHSKLDLKDKTKILHDEISDVFGKESIHYSFQTTKTKKLFMVVFLQNMKNVNL